MLRLLVTIGRVWLYAGRETYLYGRGKEIGDLKSVLRKGHYEVSVP